MNFTLAKLTHWRPYKAPTSLSVWLIILVLLKGEHRQVHGYLSTSYHVWHWACLIFFNLYELLISVFDSPSVWTSSWIDCTFWRTLNNLFTKNDWNYSYKDIVESVHIQFMGMNQKCVLIFNQIPSAPVVLKLRNPRLENICVISYRPGVRETTMYVNTQSST